MSDTKPKATPMVEFVVKLIENRATRTVGLMIMAFLAGSGGAAGFSLFGKEAAHEEYATVEQVDALVEAIGDKASAADLEIEQDRITALGAQVTTALAIIDDMHPVTRER